MFTLNVFSTLNYPLFKVLYNMNTVVFVCLQFALWQVTTALWEVNLSIEEEKCIKGLNLKKDKIIYLYFRHNTAEDIPQLNDFIQCVWSAKSFQDDSGNVNYEILKEKYNLANRIGEDDPEYLKHMRELITVAVRECQGNPPPRGSTVGQTAAKIQNCIVKNYVKAKENLK